MDVPSSCELVANNLSMFCSSGVCRSHNGCEKCDRGCEGEQNPATGTRDTALHRQFSQWQRGEGDVRGLRVETGDQRFAAECMITVLSSVKNYILIAALKLKEE